MATNGFRRRPTRAPEFVTQARQRLRVPRNGGTQPDPRSRHYVVCGDDPLALRLVEELAVRYQRRVVVILPSKERGHGPELAAMNEVRIIQADRLDADAFRRAKLGTAAALALVRQDDVGNLDAALQAQEINPDLRLVIRMFNMSLGHGIRNLFKSCRVLSDASIAAPAFVASALGEVAPSFVRLPGRTLYLAEREDVTPAKTICGLADTTTGTEPVLLPRDESRCNLVLAVADGGNGGTGPVRGEEQTALARASRRSRLAGWYRQLAAGRLFGSVVNRNLRIATLVLLGVVVLGSLLLASLSRGALSLWQAFYLTVLNIVGGVNPEPDGRVTVQVLQVVVMLAGLAMIPVITAAVVEAVVNARLALALGRLRGPIADHVVVVGLGNVGTRVIQQLRDLGIPVVAIDRTDQARGAQLARDLGVPLIIGDASRAETLDEASAGTARSLVVLSTDDVINLEAALHGRTLKKDLRVVLRLFDGDFADRIQHAFGVTSSKSVSYLAAPAFAAAMLEREVIATIPVKRRVLLVAEVPVEPGAALCGRTVAAGQYGGEARIIAVTAGEFRDAEWVPPPDRVLAPGERLIVVATRAGLGRLVAQSTPTPPPLPPAPGEDSRAGSLS
ncbi:NAD-binding protein [Rugosimonospora africana]|uniref:Potassium transporter TrkA n=1 Tax=Rugosimonospora africana TaxID=556532 RepID=A0A8J3VTJ1_9ACTN|nr:NAD-binding protein [Rugosimonospora africana]GIH17563.1 potassium transporter TrkA [Rugosimonospora africana]